MSIIYQGELTESFLTFKKAMETKSNLNNLNKFIKDQSLLYDIMTIRKSVSYTRILSKTLVRILVTNGINEVAKVNMTNEQKVAVQMGTYILSIFLAIKLRKKDIGLSDPMYRSKMLEIFESGEKEIQAIADPAERIKAQSEFYKLMKPLIKVTG